MRPAMRSVRHSRLDDGARRTNDPNHAICLNRWPADVALSAESVFSGSAGEKVFTVWSGFAKLTITYVIKYRFAQSRTA